MHYLRARAPILVAALALLDSINAQTQSPSGVTLTQNGTPYFSATAPVVGTTYANGQTGTAARVTTIINANPPGTFTFTVPGGTVPPTGSYTISPTAVNTYSNLSPPDVANLQSASDAARLAATIGGLLATFGFIGALAFV